MAVCMQNDEEDSSITAAVTEDNLIESLGKLATLLTCSIPAMPLQQAEAALDWHNTAMLTTRLHPSIAFE